MVHSDSNKDREFIKRLMKHKHLDMSQSKENDNNDNNDKKSRESNKKRSRATTAN